LIKVIVDPVRGSDQYKMVLLLDGVEVGEEVPIDSRSLYHLAPSLKDKGIEFASRVGKMVGPMGLLYVYQREFAIVAPQDKHVSIMGTDGCTTCLAMVIRHPGTGVVALGHFESVCVDGISLMIQRLQETTTTYFDEVIFQMHLVGSFNDLKGYSQELIYNVLQYVHRLSIKIDLVAACLGEINTTIRASVPWPIVYGIGVNLRTGDIFPATFPDRGPDIPLRGARIFTGSHALQEIYDYGLGLLRIGPFHYEPMRCANILLQQSDEFILQHLSSSPQVEPPHVVDYIKSTLKHIQEHPFPEITVFQDNRPRWYRKDENGQWIFTRMDSFRFENLP